MINVHNCFDDPDFVQYWEEVTALGLECWDDGWQLNLLVELYNEGCPVPDAYHEMMNEESMAAYDAAMSIPPWDR